MKIRAMAVDPPKPGLVQWSQLRPDAALARSMKYLIRVRVSLEALDSSGAVPSDQSQALKRIVDEIEELVRATNAESSVGRRSEND